MRRGDVARLNWEMVATMRSEAAAIPGSRRHAARELAPRYGVAANTVRQVLRGVRWPESARPTRGQG